MFFFFSGVCHDDRNGESLAVPSPEARKLMTLALIEKLVAFRQPVNKCPSQGGP